MTGEGIAAIIVAAGGFVTSVGTLIMQFKQATLSRANSDKLDEQGGKLDDVHQATASLVESTGTHPALKSE